MPHSAIAYLLRAHPTAVAPHQPCTGARSASPHWMDSTDYLAGAQSDAGAHVRRDPEALPARQPSSRSLIARRPRGRRGPWKLPELWTQKTRPQLLGNHTTVSTATTAFTIHFLLKKNSQMVQGTPRSASLDGSISCPPGRRRVPRMATLFGGMAHIRSSEY
jgi:hypothetical protein